MIEARFFVFMGEHLQCLYRYVLNDFPPNSIKEYSL